MRIVYVITKSDLGGAQSHVSFLSENMKERGYDVTVIAGGNGELIKRLKLKNINVYSIKNLQREINFFKDILSILEISWILWKINPTLVSAHSFKAGLFVRLIRMLGIVKRCIFTAHGWSHIKTAKGLKKFLFILLEKYLKYFCDALITVCKSDYNFAMQHSIGLKKNTHIIYNGTIDKFGKDFFKFKKSQNDTFSLLSISRMSEPKDPFMLINALANLKDENWVLNLIGDGIFLSEIKLLAKKREIYKKINFKGAQKNVYEDLANSDIFILCSKSEGFPRSIIEAMHASMPVIASNVGGVSEAISAGINGELIHSNNPQELSFKIKQFLEDPNKVFNFGKESRRKYEKYYTIENMFEETEKIYSVCKNKYI